jgi:16S rRNA (cytidine1402-2'-O)-methyltransferase
MPTFYLVSTPIGNLDDITYRAVKVLGSVDALACEDTRHTRIILDHYGIQPPPIVLSYHEYNEETSGRRILSLLEEGKSVALCTNAGTPGISDPGYRIIAACIEKGIAVESIPGPTAAIIALTLSGLPVSSFTFKGFPPKKPGQLEKFLFMERDLPHSLIFYESPFRIGPFLAQALLTLGDRRAAVCIELTKKFEKVRRGWLSELSAEFADARVKGEITVVIAGNNPKFMRPAEFPTPDGEYMTPQ